MATPTTNDQLLRDLVAQSEERMAAMRREQAMQQQVLSILATGQNSRTAAPPQQPQAAPTPQPQAVAPHFSAPPQQSAGTKRKLSEDAKPSKPEQPSKSRRTSTATWNLFKSCMTLGLGGELAETMPIVSRLYKTIDQPVKDFLFRRSCKIDTQSKKGRTASVKRLIGHRLIAPLRESIEAELERSRSYRHSRSETDSSDSEDDEASSTSSYESSGSESYSSDESDSDSGTGNDNSAQQPAPQQTSAASFSSSPVRDNDAAALRADVEKFLGDDPAGKCAFTKRVMKGLFSRARAHEGWQTTGLFFPVFASIAATWTHMEFAPKENGGQCGLCPGAPGPKYSVVLGLPKNEFQVACTKCRQHLELCSQIRDFWVSAVSDSMFADTPEKREQVILALCARYAELDKAADALSVPRQK